MGFSLKKIVKSLNPAKAVKSAIKSAGEINAEGFKAIASGVTAFGGVVKAGTQIAKDNPALAGLAGTALGVPGLGGAFSGGSGGALVDPGPQVQAAPVAAPEAPKTPMWVWLAAAGGALVLALILFRKKS